MFPTFMYDRVAGARLIQTEADFAALDPAFRDTPAFFLNPAADCCAPAAASRGYQHAEDCAFGAPDSAAPVVATPAKRKR